VGEVEAMGGPQEDTLTSPSRFLTPRRFDPELGAGKYWYSATPPMAQGQMAPETFQGISDLVNRQGAPQPSPTPDQMFWWLPGMDAATEMKEKKDFQF